jgi:hypothetical protein
LETLLINHPSQNEKCFEVERKLKHALCDRERKIHKKIYEPIGDKGTWRIRTIEELNNLYRDTDTVQTS